jgi:outer membrane receptor protein involved in Fe transport
VRGDLGITHISRITSATRFLLAALTSTLAATPATAQRESHTGTWIIDAATLTEFHPTSISDALAGLIPGMSVLRSSGVTGSATSVHSRGLTGLVAPLEPMLVVDGVRVHGAQSGLNVLGGIHGTSRLDDIPLHDVDRIEVLSGAAAAQYGGDASAGVIRVFTKHGAGDRRRNAFVEGSTASDVASYPANYATTNGPSGSTVSWNPIENASPFRSGNQLRGGLGAAGGDSSIAYFVSVNGAAARGVLSNSTLGQWSGRANVSARPSRALSVGARAWWMGARRHRA